MPPFHLSCLSNQLTDFPQCLLYFEFRGFAFIDRDCSIALFLFTNMHTIDYFFEMNALMEAQLACGGLVYAL